MAKSPSVDYERELVVRTAGALPVVAALCERLGLVEAVDRFCPIRQVADFSHGQVVLALVANRLLRTRGRSPASPTGASATRWPRRSGWQRSS